MMVRNPGAEHHHFPQAHPLEVPRGWFGFHYIKDADPEGCWLDQLKVQNHGQDWGYMASIGASNPLFFGLRASVTFDAGGTIVLSFYCRCLPSDGWMYFFFLRGVDPIIY